MIKGFDMLFRGEDMQESPSWRALLGQSIRDPQERQRIARELGVNPITLTRWVNNEATPRPRNLLRLPDVLPLHRTMLGESIAKEVTDLTLVEEVTEDTSQGIPYEFYERVLRTRASIPKRLRFLSLADLILQQALAQLVPYRLGLAVIVVQCMPPREGNQICSLRESVGRGTAPWESDLGPQAILLGAESLAGHAVTTDRLVVNQNLREEGSRFPAYRGVWEESAAACPITLEGAIAGSLLVSSARPSYFLPSRLGLVQSYADLIALAFGPEEFYEPERIVLRLVPPQDEQQPWLSSFRQRLIETITQAAKSGHPLDSMQAEQRVWQQFEEQLLQRAYHREE